MCIRLLDTLFSTDRRLQLHGQEQPHTPAHHGRARALISPSLISQSLAAACSRVQAGILMADCTNLAIIPPCAQSLAHVCTPSCSSFRATPGTRCSPGLPLFSLAPLNGVAATGKCNSTGLSLGQSLTAFSKELLQADQNEEACNLKLLQHKDYESLCTLIALLHTLVCCL